MEDNGQNPPSEWTRSIDRAEADLAAGRVFDGAEVRQRLRDTIKQMQADAVERAPQDH